MRVKNISFLPERSALSLAEPPGTASAATVVILYE
jgi:hypothetical protein